MFEQDLVDAMWKKALDNWGLVQIAVPMQDPKSEALAYIDLNTRQVVINPDRIAGLKAEASLEAIFSHELGHHLRYPASLAVQARLELLERELLPVRGYSLLNLFSDFLINTDLGREFPRLVPQFSKIYQGCPGDEKSAADDPCFYFYFEFH